jgi:DNA-binding NarL/FixJ family response regulator
LESELAEGAGGARVRFAAQRKAALVPDLLSSLSAQEHRVADLANAGMSKSKIAEALVLSVRTVESHLAQVYRKLGISNRTSLTRVMPGGGRSPAAP